MVEPPQRSAQSRRSALRKHAALQTEQLARILAPKILSNSLVLRLGSGVPTRATSGGR
jgi:hypothetical protein